jgi:signal transduction histidine kinase
MAFDLFEERRKVVEREKRLREKSSQLQRLSRHIQDMREEQNRYVAREIHDELGQALTSLDILLTLAEESAEIEGEESNESLQGTLAEAREVLGRTSTTVRSLVQELRPSVLDHLGPVEAIKVEVQEFERRTGVTASFENELSEKPAVGERCALALFRIVQEALTNVSRHAGAENLYLRISRKDRALIVSATDDGEGFDPAATTDEKTFGLLGMEERAEACGGSLEVSSKPGKGTTVEVRVPEETET